MYIVQVYMTRTAVNPTHTCLDTMYPWTSTDCTLYTCTHMTQTVLSHGRVVREYNVSMDIHGSYIVRMYMYIYNTCT